jgi:hypothetical protein
MVQLGDQVFETSVDLLKRAVLADQGGDGVALVRGKGRAGRYPARPTWFEITATATGKRAKSTR